MNEIKRMLLGELDMPEFIVLFKSSKELREHVNALVPNDAKGDINHPIWKQYDFSALQAHNFDLVKMMEFMFQFNGTSGDNLNIFGTIKRFYLFSYPNTKCTSKYSDIYGVYLTASRDCFDGPEVRDLLEHILKDAILLKTKKAREEYAKSEIKKHFHVEGLKYPRWIQGAEWPMGVNSPMRFLSRSRKGETITFLFEDVDTKEKRTVEQYY